MLVDTDAHIPQHVFVQTHIAFHLGQRCRRAVDVQQRIMALPVLFDPVGEGFKSPVFVFRDLAAVFLEDFCHNRREGFDLGRGNVWACDVHAFV